MGHHHAARPLALRAAFVLPSGRVNSAKARPMPKIIEHVHWPDAPNLWMPYAPAIKVRGGTTVYLAGVTAAPVYHHHPHRPEEFDAMPSDMEGQARAALDNLQRGLKAVGASFADIVTADRFVTDLSDQDALNRVWADYFGEARPTTTTVQVDQRDCRDRLTGSGLRHDPVSRAIAFVVVAWHHGCSGSACAGRCCRKTSSVLPPC
jgi:2-iminobutanoate/2-iminopropanoate deaminase